MSTPKISLSVKIFFKAPPRRFEIRPTSRVSVIVGAPMYDNKRCSCRFRRCTAEEEVKPAKIGSWLPPPGQEAGLTGHSHRAPFSFPPMVGRCYHHSYGRQRMALNTITRMDPNSREPVHHLSNDYSWTYHYKICYCNCNLRHGARI